MKITLDELRGLNPWHKESLTELSLEYSGKMQGMDINSLLRGATYLEKLDLSGFDTSNISNMEYMFWRCESLKELDLTGFDTSKVTDMNSMFEECRALEALDVSHFDTSNVTNMKNMFYRCASLAKIDLSGFDFSGVTSMKDMFTDCRSLREVILSDTLLRAKCLVKRVINKNKLPKGAFIDEHGDPCYYGYGNAGPYSAYEDRIGVPLWQLEYKDFSFDQTTQAEWREYLGLHGLAVLTVVPHRTKAR